MERTHPVASDVLEDGLGFLTPFDTASFDKAVHEFLNGEYYRCPASASEIANRLVTLRERREEETYLLILKTFFLVIGKCRMDRNNAYGPAVLMQVQRPWGRGGENTDCWALSLHALLRENPPNKFQPKGRKSVFSILEKEMPPMAFPFTVELLKDALRLYTTPYGQIADTEPVKFTLCDCIDDDGEPLNHFLPCEKPAVVLCMNLYTEEEVLRQEAEEKDLFEIFWELEMDICAWLLTPEGVRELALETTRRKSQLMTDIRVRDHISGVEIQKLKDAKKEQKEEMKKVDLYNDREPAYMHGIYSDEQRDELIKKHQDLVTLHEARIEAVIKSVEKLNVMAQSTMIEQKRLVAEDVMTKYAKLIYDASLHPLRRYAAQFKVGRPWDGFGGAAFDEWKSRHAVEGGEAGAEDDESTEAGSPDRRVAAAKKKVLMDKSDKLPSRTMELTKHDDALEASRLSCHEALQAHRRADDIKRKANAPGGFDEDDDNWEPGDELTPEYTWDDTELMGVWKCEIYEVYKRKMGEKRAINDIVNRI